jgi:hypothetical protein
MFFFFKAKLNTFKSRVVIIKILIKLQQYIKIFYDNVPNCLQYQELRRNT